MWSTLGSISHKEIITAVFTIVTVTSAIVAIAVEELTRRGAKLAIKLLKRKFANI